MAQYTGEVWVNTDAGPLCVCFWPAPPVLGSLPPPPPTCGGRLQALSAVTQCCPAGRSPPLQGMMTLQQEKPLYRHMARPLQAPSVLQGPYSQPYSTLRDPEYFFLVPFYEFAYLIYQHGNISCISCIWMYCSLMNNQIPIKKDETFSPQARQYRPMLYHHLFYFFYYIMQYGGKRNYAEVLK